MAITDGQFGKPVTRKGRFFNCNHPLADATKQEIEVLEKFWGQPTAEDGEWAEALRNRVVKTQKNKSGVL